MRLNRRHFALATFASCALPLPAFARGDGFAEAAAYSADRRGVSMLVVQDGRIVFEHYPRRGRRDRAWALASGTKSFSGVLAAAMVQDGLLRLDERCVDTLTEWRAVPGKGDVTIRQLLTLVGGVGGGPIGRPPTYADAVATPLSSAPGTRFEYGPLPFQVFGEIVRRKLVAAGGKGDVYAFLRQRLLDPVGIVPGDWRHGSDGHPHLPSGAELTARDWAKFGSFVLAGGRVGDRQIVDPDTLAACFEGTTVNPGYGITWWLPRPGLIAPPGQDTIEAEAASIARLVDVRIAAGAGDQRLYVIPGHRMIVVRQAGRILASMLGGGSGWSDLEFLRLILG